jgi:hypothetical protein
VIKLFPTRCSRMNGASSMCSERTHSFQSYTRCSRAPRSCDRSDGSAKEESTGQASRAGMSHPTLIAVTRARNGSASATSG